MPFELQRTVAGLLDSDDFDRPSAGGVGADWTATGGTWGIASNVECRETSATSYLLNNVVAARQDVYLQATMQNGGTGVQAALVARYSATGPVAYKGVLGGTPDAGATWRTSAASESGDLAFTDNAVSHLTAQRRINFLCEGATLKVWKEGLLQATYGAATLRTGLVGFHSTQGVVSTVDFDDFYACRSATVTVTGLQNGYSIRIGALESDPEVSGVCTLDVGGLAMPLAAIEVLDGDGDVVDTFADPAFGGDEYEWIDPDPPFLQVGSVIVLVEGSGANEQEPDVGGQVYRTYGGSLRSNERWRKRSWSFTSIEMTEAEFQTLRTEVAPPGLVDCYGLALDGDIVPCHVAITAAPYTRQPDGTHKRTVSLAVREV